MTNITVQNGLNTGTSGNDVFTVPSGLTQFEIQAGDGIDTLISSIENMRKDVVDWSTFFVENYVFTGSSSVYFAPSFGSFKKTIDFSQTTSTTIAIIKDDNPKSHTTFRIQNLMMV